jgi:hypothetical protein
MPCPTQILVSGAGLSAVNGVYLSAGNFTYSVTNAQDEEIPLFTRTFYTKDGGPVSAFIPYIQASAAYGGGARWVVHSVQPIYNAVATYLSPPFNPSPYDAVLPECPLNLTYTKIELPNGVDAGNGPTITEYRVEPTFGLPAESVALIVSRFGTVANFLRLRNLGQV